MDFWDRVQAEIGRGKTTYAYIAKQIDKTESTVSGWHRGEKKIIPPANLAVKIAQILDTTVEYLITGNPPVPGISPEALRIAQNFDNLSPAGQKAAQSMMEGLLRDYPQQTIQEENPAG
jgi:transcriptional regulator with XRE-family HTH domain